SLWVFALPTVCQRRKAMSFFQKTSPLKPPRLWTDAPPTIPAQQPGGGGKRPKDGHGTTQRLEFTAGPLRRLHPQCLIPGGHLRDGASVGTAATPPTPPDRPKEARALACGQALTPQEDPALWAARPGGRTAGAFGQYGFDTVDGEHAGHLLRREDHCGEGGRVFDRAE